jgi:hypothetical protein
MRHILSVSLASLAALAGCAQTPTAAAGGANAPALVRETLDKVCIPSALAARNPAILAVTTDVDDKYSVQDNPITWRAPQAATQLRLDVGGCMISTFAGDPNAIREQVLAAASAAGFKSLYSGPNATGATLRDVQCFDRTGGGSAGMVVSTAKSAGQSPTLMVSTVHSAQSCAQVAETSNVAIPRGN